MTSDEFSEFVVKCLRSGSRMDLVGFEADLVSEIAEGESFPPEWFDALTRVLNEPQTALHPDAWKLVHMWSTNWDDMDTAQQERAEELLVEVFGRGPDWMMALSIGETLADNAAPSAVADWITRESQIRRGPLLACLIHAIAHLWPRLHEEDQRKSLRELVIRSARDPDEEVRREAAATLGNLA
jgi:hypothetical protein